MGVGVYVGVGVCGASGVGVGGAGVGVGGGGCCTARSTTDQILSNFPVPPTVLGMLSGMLSGVFNTGVRVNGVPTVKWNWSGDSSGDPVRTQISLSTVAVQTTSTGSGGV